MLVPIFPVKNIQSSYLMTVMISWHSFSAILCILPPLFSYFLHSFSEKLVSLLDRFAWEPSLQKFWSDTEHAHVFRNAVQLQQLGQEFVSLKVSRKLKERSSLLSYIKIVAFISRKRVKMDNNSSPLIFINRIELITIISQSPSPPSTSPMLVQPCTIIPSVLFILYFILSFNYYYYYYYYYYYFLILYF